MNNGKSGWKVLISIILCTVLVLAITAYAGETVTFSLGSNAIDEGAVLGTKIGDFQLTSEDTNPIYSLAAGQEDNESFSISGSSLYSAAVFDYETQSSYTVVVNVTADNDGTGQETFTVNINDISPAASSTSISVAEDGSVSGTLPLSGDNTSVTFEKASDPLKGTVNITESGTYTYAPKLNENGEDSFQYRVSDGVNTDIATITVSISAVNDDPVITQGDSATITCYEDGNAESVALSATDPEDDSLEWTVGTPAAYGTGSVDLITGYASYTPTEKDYNGQDSFTVSVSDGKGGSDTITVAVTITPVNDPPTFTAGNSVTVDEDSDPLPIDDWILAMSPGPSNESGQTVSFNVTYNSNTALFSTQPAVDENGTLSFVLAANANGQADITLSAHDSEGADSESTQNFSIIVNAVDDAPVCTSVPQITGTPHNGQMLTASSGSWNDTLDGQDASAFGYTYQWQSAVSQSGPWNEIDGAAANTYTLTVNENALYVRVAVTCTETGSDALSSTAYSEGELICNEAPVFSESIVAAMTFTEDDGADTIDLNASDSDGDTLSWEITDGGTKGDTSIVGYTVTYTPHADANGEDSFTVTVRDDNDGSDEITITVSITPVNDPPSFSVGENQSVPEDSIAQTVSNWPSTMSVGPANEVDDGQTMIITVTGNTAASLFSDGPAISSTGTLTYTPAANAFGTAVITLTAEDSAGEPAAGTYTFSITITPVNDPPANTQAPAISGVMHNGQTITASSGTWNDDTDGTLASALTYAYQWQYAAGDSGPWTGIAGATSASYQLTADENNQYIRVMVTCTDTDTQPLSTAVYSAALPVLNAAPVISQGEEISMSQTEDAGAKTLKLDATDSDGDALSWEITTGSGKGITSIDGSTVSYQPKADENGNDSFIVSVSDDNGGSDSITVNVTIDAENDNPTFTIGENQTVDEDCQEQIIDSWITQMSKGADNESGQILTFSVTNIINAALLTGDPTVDGETGTLIYTPADNAHGVVTITLSLSDDEGGVCEDPQNFTITINPVNDAPVNTELPTISGTFTVGGTLSASKGTWNDNADGNTLDAEDFSYTWQTAEDTDGSGLAQVGTGESYQLALADAHKYIRLKIVVTDTDATGTETAEAYSTWYAVANSAPSIEQAEPAITTDEDIQDRKEPP